MAGSLWAIQVSIADTDGAKRIWDMLAAVDATVPKQCSAVRIQAEYDNAANPVLLGDSNIGASRYGAKLLAHDQIPYQHSVASGMPFTELYALNPTAATTVKMNIEVWLW